MQDLKRVLSKYANVLKKGEQEVDFYFLLRLFELLNKKSPRIGTANNPQEEIFRFGQKPFLHFAPSAVAQITKKSDLTQEQWLILVYFFGFLGPQGPLSLETTSYIYQRCIHEYDGASSRFLDIINHRLISFFYRAFAQNEIAISFDRADDLIRVFIKAITGQNLSRNTTLPPYTIEALSPFFSMRSRSRDGLTKLLQNFFTLPIKVTDFKVVKHCIPKNLRFKLADRENSILGVSAMLGSHYYSQTKAVVVELGPISYEDSFDFMPKRRLFWQLCELVSLYVQKVIELYLVIKINASTIKQTVIGGNFALGQSCYLLSGQKSTNCNIKTIEINVSSILKNVGRIYEA